MKLAILISGRGSNFQAIHRAVLAKQLDAQIALVLSDQAQAAGLDYAREQQLPTAVIAKHAGESRASHDARILETLQSLAPDYIALAGYMRILGKDLVEAFPLKIVNIHPSLLPAFPGLHAQRQALESGAKFSGCTVHFVDAGCDTGPIIAQQIVPVLEDDTEDSLSARILTEEHRLYPQCLQWLAQGKVTVQGRHVRISK